MKTDDMKKVSILIGVVLVFIACDNGRENAVDGTDTTSQKTSTTPPPKPDTNPVGIMMGDTTIGINDSLKVDSLKK